MDFLKKAISFSTLLLTVFFSVIVCNSSSAATIKGYLIDKESGEQIVGAIIVLEGTKFNTVTGLDGKYVIKNVPAGKYKVRIQYPSYESVEQEISLTDEQSFSFDVKMKAKNEVMKEVKISGKYIGGTDEDVQNREKNGHEIMNIMSAHTIQLSPDITVANVLQRISGVSTESTNSGRQYAIIRGMDKKYNSTLVNGVKIPSPNDRDRYVPVDIFPAELLERLEVIKTLSPSMEADATGGVVNMVMKNAPDTFVCDVNFGAGYSAIFQDMNFLKYSSSTVKWQSPAELTGPNVPALISNFPIGNLLTTPVSNPINTNYGFTIGNRFFHHKLGVIAAGSFQNTYKGYKSAAFLESPTVPPAISPNTPLIQPFSDLNYRTYSTLSQRLGLMARADYEMNEKNSLSLFLTTIQLNEYRTRFTGDSTLGGSTLQGGYIGYAGVKTQVETRSTLQTINNITLQGRHKLSSVLSVDWSLVASQAKEQLPDDATWAFTNKTLVDTTTKTLIFEAPKVDNMHRQWQRNKDNDLAAYLNFHYSPSFLTGLNLIDFGGLYRHKTRDNYHNEYTLTPISDSASSEQKYTSIQAAKFTWTADPLGMPNDPFTYTYHEDIIATYLQLNYDVTRKLNLYGGVRMEITNGGYECGLPVTQAGKTATYVYTDFLPSVQAKYAINEKSALRGSYFMSIYRPAYGDLIPTASKTIYDDYDFVGNDTLQHTVIHNFDVRYEIYPKGLDQIMVGVFSKIIQNPIENTIARETKTTEEITPLNFGTAYNNGFEFVIRKFFGTIGVSANYTFTNSQITTTKLRYFLDSTRSKKQSYTDTVNQTRPLVNQAAHIGNISLLYKTPRIKLDMQLAFTYTGERLNTVSPYNNLDIWQKPVIGLDFSAEKRFGKHVAIYIKANNLLNSGYELFLKTPNDVANTTNKLRYQDNASYISVQKDFYSSTFLLGFKYKF